MIFKARNGNNSLYPTEEHSNGAITSDDSDNNNVKDDY